MAFTVITNPSFRAETGFTQGQFKKLDDLYCRAAAAKTLTYRSVECDFEEGMASYTYYQSEGHAPLLQFVLRRVGPKAMMYEIYRQGGGMVFKSGVFETAHLHLKKEIEKILPAP